MSIKILSHQEIEHMRVVGKLAADTLRGVKKLIRPGISTKEIDDFVFEDTRAKGCKPAPLGYTSNPTQVPYPASVCTSVNEVAAHGIPSARRLQNGDIINVDVTHICNGWHGDTSATFIVGEASEKVEKLVSVARNALAIGIALVKPGERLGTIGFAIDTYVSEQGFSVVRDYTGHGIGRKFHDLPSIFHHGIKGRGMRLKEGMTFTIEPMVNMGDHHVDVLDDEWTVVTRDGLPSAQFEHTLLVTTDGCEILTLPSRF